MKWLKYQHKHSSGRSGWLWKPLYEDNTQIDDAYVRSEILPDITEEYSYSDKYSGVDYEIVDKPPRWVIEQRMRSLSHQVAELQNTVNTLGDQLVLGNVEVCKQCDGALPAPEFNRGADENAPCPLCGRAVVRKTLKFWLDPADTVAVKLLGSLVVDGERSVKSKTFRWPVEDEDEEEAYGRLCRLGLAGGSSYQNTYKIYATKNGIAEWYKHKGAVS